jgi:hypothetical protein
MHCVRRAECRELPIAGSTKAIKIPMMKRTTINSINEKARGNRFRFVTGMSVSLVAKPTRRFYYSQTK